MKSNEFNELANKHPLKDLPRGRVLAHLVGQIGFSTGDVWARIACEHITRIDTDSVFGSITVTDQTREDVANWQIAENSRRAGNGNPEIPASDSECRIEIVRLMSEASESIWCASWLVNLEYVLWEMLEGERPIPDTAEWEMEEIRKLIQAIDSYPLPCDEPNEVATEWVSLEEARSFYQAAREHRP